MTLALFSSLHYKGTELYEYNNPQYSQLSQLPISSETLGAWTSHLLYSLPNLSSDSGATTGFPL